MALIIQLPTQVHYEEDGVQTVWPFSFVGGYIAREHVRAYRLSDLEVRTDLVLTDANFVTDFQLEIVPAGVDGHKLVIYRDTSNGGLPLVDFADGNLVDEASLDIVAKQSVFVAAESADFLGVTTTADLQDLAQAAATSAGAAAASSAGAASSAAGSATAASSAAASATGAASSASAAAVSAANTASAVNALRDELASPASAADGDALLGVGKTSTNSVATTQHEVNERCLHLRDFLTDAQRADVVARTLTIDCWAGLQAAIAAAIALRMPLDLGEGRIRVSAATPIPNNLAMFGRGRGSGLGGVATDIVPENNTFPALTAASANAADFRNVHLSDFRITGGQNNIRLEITGTMSGCSFKNLWLTAPSQDNFYVAQMFISSSLRDVVFDSTPSTYAGFKVAAPNTNNVLFDNCWWIESDGRSIDINSGESVTIVNPRFEARKTAEATGGTVINLAAVKSWQILGGYVENTYVNFLTETGSTGTGKISCVRFSGAEFEVGSDGFKAFTFVSDGIVTFDCTQFNVSSDGPAQVMLSGRNSGLSTRNSAVWEHNNSSRKQVTTKQIQVTSSGVAENLFTFDRISNTGTFHRQSLAGWLNVLVQGITSGGTKSFMSSRTPILIDGFAASTMVTVLPAAVTGNDNAVGATLTIAEVVGASSTSVTVAATYTLGSLESAEMIAMLDLVSIKTSSAAVDYINITPVAS